MLSVNTCLSKQDITSATISRFTRPRVLLTSWSVWSLFVALFLAFKRGLPHDLIGALTLVISASLGALLSVLVSLAFLLLRVRGSLKDGDGVLGEHDYQITADGLLEKTAVNETIAKWSGIKEVQKTSKFAFIELKNGALHIIALRFFSSQSYEAAFLSEIQRRIETVA